ncbi:hypothetical protein BAUCODRAFT_61559 [Baudoinia panamericana UAMH 10762]|uniref:Uncharacterized protein n=1 Tax=Baudoinia panamericana (strain UAMH 10762) TaxID=717646 RepID=M2NMT7_BAUPA|nr:uncharacterized protein BAUCODRAFT_61559 [Baudoinia panamericana UAMH 10762]EMD00501.1 hypothetical protein BAUCODRAFT_61559 [Baudoinia panamericana UAMH 10762]
MAAVLDAPEAPIITTRVPPASRLPSSLRFVLLCLMSFSLSMLFNSMIADFAGYELAAVSREVREEGQIYVTLGWKFATLSAAWYAGYDWQDIAALAILCNLPYYYLLTTFYNISVFSSSIALLIDISAIAIPFSLLRPLIHAHDPEGHSPNQQVAKDRYLNTLVAILGATVYALVIYGSLYTWLPVYLVQNFDGIVSLERAHDANVLMLLLYFLPIGWSTSRFLFMAAIGSRGNPGLTDPDIYPEKVDFDPETATFTDTLAFNLGFGTNGFSKRAEVLGKRTMVLVAASVINTFVRTVLTIAGSEPVGSLGWASVWGVAAVLTGLAFAWTGNE